MTARKFLLDTNALSEVIRRPQGSVGRRIAAVGEERICTSIVVACELRFGAYKKASAALTHRVEQLLNSMEVLPLERGVDRVYGQLRATLEAAGHPIGGNDLLIAAQALHAGLLLVTSNLHEFRRVPRLEVHDWLTP